MIFNNNVSHIIHNCNKILLIIRNELLYVDKLFLQQEGLGLNHIPKAHNGMTTPLCYIFVWVDF